MKNICQSFLFGISVYVFLFISCNAVNQNDKNKTDGGALYQATVNGDAKAVKSLLKKGYTPYITPYQLSGIPEKDDSDKDAYYAALKNGYIDIAEMIYAKLMRPPYWVGRDGFIFLDDRYEIDDVMLKKIEFAKNHQIILPITDIIGLIETYERSDGELMESCAILLNAMAKFDAANHTYSDIGIDLSYFLDLEAAIPETWISPESMIDIAGKWYGSKTITIPASSFDLKNDSSVLVRIEMIYKRNANEFSYTLSFDFDVLLDDMVQSINLPLNNSSKNVVWKSFAEAMAFERFDLKKYYLRHKMSIPINNLAGDISRGDFSINDKKTKIKHTVDLNRYLPVGRASFILDKE